MATPRVLASALQLNAGKMNYSSIKLASKTREAEEKRQHDRKRAAQILVHHYLEDEGYIESARIFQKEARLSEQFTICDNIDLPTVIHEFETYYNLRFQKLPKFFKVVDQSSSNTLTSILPKKNKKKLVTTISSPILPPASPTNHGRPEGRGEENSLCEISVQAIPILSRRSLTEDLQECVKNKPLKLLSSIDGVSDEWKQFAEVIAQEILEMNLHVSWDDVIGLEDAKKLLKEAVVYPTKYPELFNGILTPWKGILLYGPPGTGKTLLAKAVASECKTTFFNISACSIVSKWRGDSEKLVRVMFEMARYNAPSTIFLDEIDALVSKRGCKSEHEASRRLKTEILIQLDGLSQSNDRIFFLANSNLPWELDPAMLRRLEKRILVDIPEADAREKLFQYYLPPVVMISPLMKSHVDYTALAQASEYYTGSDIKIVCKEAAMNVMRKVFDTLDGNNKGPPGSDHLVLETITTDNVIEAMEKTKPLTVKFILQYKTWQTECGSV